MNQPKKQTDEKSRKKLSEEKLGNAAGGIKNYNSSKSNTSSVITRGDRGGGLVDDSVNNL